MVDDEEPDLVAPAFCDSESQSDASITDSDDPDFQPDTADQPIVFEQLEQGKV